MKLNKIALSFKMTALSTLVMAQVSAFAQETPPDDDSIEVIAVSGIRSSLLNSRLTKKNTDTISDVISAEDIGQFPDVNVAESLSRLPGFSVDRQFGEGEKVSIHGTDPALNRIFVDGHPIASADWGGNPNDVTGRTFNYSLLAPEIIGQARVYKNPEAWIDEGSIGGTVIIETRKPLDMDANTFSASIGNMYNDRSEKGNMRGSALYSWKNEDETLGFLVAATYDKQSLNRAGIEYFGYSSGSIFADSFDTTTDADGNVTSVTGPDINGAAPTVDSYNEMLEARVPCCINFAYFEQERKRAGLSLAAQWKPNDDTKFTLTGLRIDGDYTNHNRSMYSVAAWGGNRATDIYVDQGIISQATVEDTGYVGFDPENPDAETNYATNAQYDSYLRRSKLTTDSINLDGEWSNGIWSVSGKAGYTKATGGKDPEYGVSFNYPGAFDFQFSQDSTYQQYADDPSDPTTFFRNSLTLQTVNGEEGYYYQAGGMAYEIYTDDEVYGQLDFKYMLDSKYFTELRFGFKASSHENKSDAKGRNLYMTELTDIADFDYSTSPSGLWDGLGTSGNATQFAILTDQGIEDAYAAGVLSDWVTNYGSTFTVKEDIQAAYIQGGFEVGENLRGNVGVRLVRTTDDSYYWLYDTETDAWSEETSSQDYTKALPSINVVYSLTDDVLLKAGMAKVIARPRYGQLAGSFSLNNTQLTGGGGNPDLEPYESTNYEVSAEYYFSETGLVAAEVFMRDISSYIVTTTEDKELYNTNTGSTSIYSIVSPFNAESAEVTGIALQGQTEIGYGFGIAANVTFADADTPSNDYYMPYLSDTTYNISPYFEKGPLQLRLSYGYRSSYFTSIGRLSSKDYTDDYTQVDFSATYDINENFSFTLRGSNLLDETYYQFSSVTIAPTSFYKNGRQFSANLNYRM